ncbi:MAG: GTPase [Thermoplasmata archaeon]
MRSTGRAGRSQSARPSRRGDEADPPPSEEILEVAFHRASRANPGGTTKPERDRRRATLKVVRSGATVQRQVRRIAAEFTRPPLTDFERALLDRRFGPGRLDRSLGRLRRAVERIRERQREAERELAAADGPDALGETVRRFYGRIASHVREIDPDLAFLREVRAYRKERPTIDPSAPTLVVAGFPNVGKSALVARLSTARPRVAPFPFTTLALEVGHADLGSDRWQVLDTPGVLDRAGRKNPAEAEAETAVQHGARAVLFVLDPTGDCGHSVEEQEALLSRWRQELGNRPILVVESKSDRHDRHIPGRLRTSAVTGEGIAELEAAIAALGGGPASVRPARETAAGDAQDAGPTAASPAHDGRDQTE